MTNVQKATNALLKEFNEEGLYALLLAYNEILCYVIDDVPHNQIKYVDQITKLINRILDEGGIKLQ